MRLKRWENAEKGGICLCSIDMKKRKIIIDIVQYRWYYNVTEKKRANTRGKQGGGLARKAQPFPILKRDGEKAKWYLRKGWVQWYQKRHPTSSRDSPRRCNRNDQGDSYKKERVPSKKSEPPEKRDRLLNKVRNGTLEEAILVNIHPWNILTMQADRGSRKVRFRTWKNPETMRRRMKKYPSDNLYTAKNRTHPIGRWAYWWVWCRKCESEHKLEMISKLAESDSGDTGLESNDHPPRSDAYLKLI